MALNNELKSLNKSMQDSVKGLLHKLMKDFVGGMMCEDWALKVLCEFCDCFVMWLRCFVVIRPGS